MNVIYELFFINMTSKKVFVMKIDKRLIKIYHTTDN